MLQRLVVFMNPFDGRYEDLRKGDWRLNVFRDFTAGLIIAMIAIPLAMGFAMASGLRPEQGIVGGAVAGAVGALFGGSKYQVYGPTAAYIPVIAAIMAHPPADLDPEEATRWAQTHGHGFLVTASIIAGVILALMGLFKVGRVVKLVPHSIVVGFTIGIAGTIALSQGGEVLGLKAKLGYEFADKVRGIWEHRHSINGWALILALGVFAMTKLLLKVSVYLPAPLVSIGVGTLLSQTLLKEQHLTTIYDKFKHIPTDFGVLTPPSWSALSHPEALAHAVIAIVVVAAIESLLCSRMADRLANNTGQPFNANKELWGQGLVQVIVPILNGFPHTGALARTATNIKVGAISPLAGIFKCALKLLLAMFLARYLEQVPMACIGGILLYVAFNMVKPSEVEEVLHMGRFHVGLMAYTAVSVFVTDFLTGVLTALVIYAIHQVPADPEDEAEEKPAEAPRDEKTRAVLERPRRSHGPAHEEPVPAGQRQWLSHIRERPHVGGSAFVHPQATVIGKVVLGEHVHIAADTSVRADEGSPFYIGSGSNVQDGVVLHALKDKHVVVDGMRWAIYIGRHVSLAHGALVHGPSYIGDDSFVGFKAVVHDAVVGAHCFVGVGSVVIGVEIPEGKFVPHGSIVDSKEKVLALPDVSEAQSEFNEDVVEVNRGLAAAYRAHLCTSTPRRLRTESPYVGAHAPSSEAGWQPPRPGSYEEPF